MNAAWATATPNQRVEAVGYDAYASIDDGEMTDCDGFEPYPFTDRPNDPQNPESWDDETKREFQAAMNALAYHYFAINRGDQIEATRDLSSFLGDLLTTRGAADAFGAAFGIETSISGFVAGSAFDQVFDLAQDTQYASANAAYDIAMDHCWNFCVATGIATLDRVRGHGVVIPPLPRANGRGG